MPSAQVVFKASLAVASADMHITKLLIRCRFVFKLSQGSHCSMDGIQLGNYLTTTYKYLLDIESDFIQHGCQQHGKSNTPKTLTYQHSIPDMPLCMP